MAPQTTAAMICEACGIACKKFGKHRNGLQRFRCRQCGVTYTEEHEMPFRIEGLLERQARHYGP